MKKRSSKKYRSRRIPAENNQNPQLTWKNALVLILLILVIAGVGASKKPSDRQTPAAQTAPQVQTVESEKALMSPFLSGLDDLERMLDDWFYNHARQAEQPVWFLKDGSSLTPSAAALLGCKVENPADEYPECRGNVYSFYELQCNAENCSWTLCRHNERPYSCTYSMNGYRDKFGRWENNCNIILPQSRAFCEYLRDEKRFIVNDIS